jgi:hypothetical protein
MSIKGLLVIGSLAATVIVSIFLVMTVAGNKPDKQEDLTPGHVGLVTESSDFQCGTLYSVDLEDGSSSSYFTKDFIVQDFITAHEGQRLAFEVDSKAMCSTYDIGFVITDVHLA